ncbi:SDR family oxidoreductase [Nocardia jinanensis]|uniref:3-oxoacyl-[acyl-carrier-protein] reductase MabA n=1 Tax=Nocardia jinanensis TaxID=382504 RepID=A0A917R4M2_9NOCA|nr:SDR family oxidoreductase [Nocardia jinanensis]GGK90078.1 3-ketoacyl-ACP reductase [Nocardia jinanensis]
MDLRLAGRAYYVTGGSRGIGRAIAELLLAEGASVATCARGAAGLGELRAALSSEHRDRLLTQTVDVADAAALGRAVGTAADRFGRLDGVVANAGAGVSGGVLTTPDTEWQDQFRVKVMSVLNLVTPAVLALQRSDAGRVVVVNGVTAHAPEASMAAVSAARAAVANLTRSLAVELAPSGVLVNAISLGAIVTDRQRARYDASGAAEPFADWCVSEATRRGVLIGRLGTPREVAPVAALLLSPLCSYVTGSSVDVSGGSGGRT